MGTARRTRFGWVASAVGTFLALAVVGSAASAASAGLRESAPDRSPAPGALQWVRAYPGQSQDPGAIESAMADSPNGKMVFVTGSTSGGAATVAYSTKTGAVLWTSMFGVAGLLGTPVALAVSPNGKTVYATAGTGGQSNYDIVAYNADTGAKRWEFDWPGAFTGNGSYWPYAIAVSPNSKLIAVTGTTKRPALIRYATVEVDASSGQWLWGNWYRGPGNYAKPSAVVVKSAGNVYVTGFTEPGSKKPSSPGAAARMRDSATVGYDHVGMQYIWGNTARRYQGATGPVSLGISPSGKTLYIAATRFGNYLVVSYAASNGRRLWARQYKPGDDQAAALALSPNGQTLYVTGTQRTAAGDKYLTVAFSTRNGRQEWARLYRAPGRDNINVPTAVAVSPSGAKIYVTGQSSGGSGVPQYVSTIAYHAATGAVAWVQRYPFDVSTPGATSLTVGPAGREILVSTTATDDSSLGSACATVSCFVTIAYNS